MIGYRNKPCNYLIRINGKNCYHKNELMALDKSFVTLSGVAIQNQQKVKL